jgi:hypothetical protein
VAEAASYRITALGPNMDRERFFKGGLVKPKYKPSVYRKAAKKLFDEACFACEAIKHQTGNHEDESLESWFKPQDMHSFNAWFTDESDPETKVSTFTGSLRRQLALLLMAEIAKEYL